MAQNPFDGWIKANPITTAIVPVIGELGQISLTRDAEPNRPKQQGNELGLARRPGVRSLIPSHQQRVTQVKGCDAGLPLVGIGILP